MTPLLGSETLYCNTPEGEFSALSTWRHWATAGAQVDQWVGYPLVELFWTMNIDVE
jgi:hypothetical protein